MYLWKHIQYISFGISPNQRNISCFWICYYSSKLKWHYHHFRKLEKNQWDNKSDYKEQPPTLIEVLNRIWSGLLQCQVDICACVLTYIMHNNWFFFPFSFRMNEYFTQVFSSVYNIIRYKVGCGWNVKRAINDLTWRFGSVKYFVLSSFFFFLSPCSRVIKKWINQARIQIVVPQNNSIFSMTTKLVFLPNGFLNFTLLKKNVVYICL